MALIAGFVCAYPINWWLVANHMKHGMMTVRRKPAPVAVGERTMGVMSGEMSVVAGPGRGQPSAGAKAAMTAFTFAFLGGALVIVVQFAM